MKKGSIIGLSTAVLATLLLYANPSASNHRVLADSSTSVRQSTQTNSHTQSLPQNDLNNVINQQNSSDTQANKVNDKQAAKTNKVSVADDQITTAGTVTPTPTANGGYELSNDTFKVDIDKNGTIQGLYLQDDAYNTNYVLNAKDNPAQNNSAHKWVGDLMFQTKPTQASGAGDVWQKEYTNYSDATRKITINNNRVVVTYTPGKAVNGFTNLAVTETYYIDNDNNLKWDITVKNDADHSLDVGDLGVPLPFKEYWGYNSNDKTVKAYQESVLFHSFVGQNSSYIYANRPSGIGNFLVMTPDASTDTGFEYQDHWTWGSHSGDEAAWDVGSGSWDNGLNVYYIHSKAIQSGNRGYLPNTDLTLNPGASKTYSFKFDSAGIKNSTSNNSTSNPTNSKQTVDGSANDHSASAENASGVGDMTNTKFESQLKSVLYKNDIMDAVSVPGMVIPKKDNGDASGKLYLHTKLPTSAISFDFQNQTNDYVSQRNNANNDTNANLGSDQQGSVNFDKTVVKDGEQYHVYNIDFHSLGRNNVIVKYTLNGQSKQTTLQYYVIENPEKALDQHANFMLKTQWNDSSKFYNKEFDDWDFNTKAKRGNFNGPDWNSLGWGDDWGLTHGLFLAAQNAQTPNKDQVQAVDDYVNTTLWNGLMKNHHNDYKVPDWLDEKATGDKDTDNYAWRGFAYPHVYNTFYEMYRIEHNYPNLINYQESAKDYLLKAYNIMKALYSSDVSYNMDGLEGESTATGIINALKENGLNNEANTLQSFMKKKYDNFAKDPYPYTSEYPYDNTGEEAVYMLGDMYDNQHMMQMVDMKTRACRGVQPVWYLYDDPVTINGENWWQFQYTASLADTAMDNWLREQNNGLSSDQVGLAERANYGAKLANLTHINSGQIDGDPANLGAVSWTYQAELGSSTQALYGVGTGKLHNGWRSLSGEADLSVFGALQVLSADVVNDPVFGLTGYGADVQDNGDSYDIKPEDGLRTRLNLLDQKLAYTFDGDKYTHANVVKDGSSATFDFENMSKQPHKAHLSIYNGNGFQEKYDVMYDGKTVSKVDGNGQRNVTLDIPVNGSNGQIQIVKASKNNHSTTNNDQPTGTISHPTDQTTANSSSTSEPAKPQEQPDSASKPAIKVGTVVYATKKIGLYKQATFDKAQRPAVYPKQNRTRRPMFVVTDYAKSTNGTLRYKVRDINYGTKTAGKVGYITANAQYVVKAYNTVLPKSKRVMVISNKGVNAYRNVSLTKKAKHYKKGAILKVKKISQHNQTTRYELTNGYFITANKKLIINK
ncbi:hypothetical protein YK48G_11740 [Lentilactobacillus fungorum]|uniref:DUF5776 domain-containing protein n=1 Tax=Lentilactobacillus fungorum TaxID=2201250 RepID=A0ABQ3W248_9LACO|nr:DUF5695 domain-containing protein [Lentilactobacillus fungorum]GHP13749.1 hypothetical protein YK48G_11740 [Lentilactobacillus fungorum]